MRRVISQDKDPAAIYMTGAFSIMQPEARLVKRTKEYLESVGARVFNIHGGDTFQEAGIPDLLVCYEGRFYGLEGKIPPNKPSRIQAEVLREIRHAGGVGAVFSSVAEVKNLLTYDPGWIAGFYEGEGSVYPQNTRQLRVSITQKDPSPLRYIQGYFGGNIRFREDTGSHSLILCARKEVVLFLETIGPLLKSKYKRDQLRAAVRKVEEATGESLYLRGYSSRTSSTRSKQSIK